MFRAAESRVQLVSKEDGIMPDQALSNKTTPAGNHSSGPLRTCERCDGPVSAPDKSPTQEPCSQCKTGSSANDTDRPSVTVDMDIPGHQPTSSPWYIIYGSMMSLEKVCRCILQAALSAISKPEKTVKEEEEEEEEEDDENDDDYKDMDEEEEEDYKEGEEGQGEEEKYEDFEEEEEETYQDFEEEEEEEKYEDFEEEEEEK